MVTRENQINAILNNISKCEHFLDLIMTQTESLDGFCFYYPADCMDRLKIMKTILEMELKI
jgi:hypothetical protein